MSTKPLVSVVVPCYNEEANIPHLLEALSRVSNELANRYTFELLLVNDGSTDGTHDALDILSETTPGLRPVHLERNQGQSAAILAGMQRARGDYVLTIDGDLQNDPADFPRVLELLADCDCVCGYRQTRHDTWVRRFSSRVANAVRNAVLHDGLRDTGCSLKGFRRACIAHLPPFNGMHRFIGVFIRRAGFRIVEAPVAHHPRRHGESKYGIHNRLWRGLFDLLGVTWLRRRFVAIQVEDEE